MYVFRSLWLNARVTNLQKHQKQNFLWSPDLWLSSVSKEFTLKAFSQATSVSLTPGSSTLFRTFFKNTGNFDVLVCCSAKK